MLRFERIGAQQELSIRYRQRDSVFDRVFIKALLWSFILHLILVTSFHIKLFDFRPSPPPLHPIALTVEEEPVAMLIAETFGEVKPLVSIDQLPPFPDTLHTLLDSNPSLPSQLYPLEIKCSSNLKRLTLVEDGSCLFKKAASLLDKEWSFLSSGHCTIEYEVSVDGATGSCVSWKRSKELLDKPLQGVADSIMNTLRFAPYKKSLSGSVWITFHCSGEDLPFLLKPSHD